jgi:hypothetical protein
VGLLGLTVGLGIVLVLLLMVFIMPSLKSGPSQLPVGIVGSTAAVATWDDALEQASPGGYDLSTYASEEELVEAIESREIVGGIAVADDEVRVSVASAGSAVISGTISTTAQAIASASGLPVAIADVVPLPAVDPTGIGIGGLAFPLVFGGIVPAVAFRSVFRRSLGWAIAGISLFSVVGGVLVASVLHLLFGSIDGSAFWPVAAAMTLGIAGLAIPLAGLKEAVGGAGFTIGAATMMFLGNPFAGISTSAAWLPDALGVFGQLLPPGAAGTLVRAAAYFDWAGGAGAALTLGIWVAAGVALLIVGAKRNRAKAISAD